MFSVYFSILLAFAQPADAPTQQEKDQLCSAIGEYAAKIMGYRHDRASLTKLLKTSDEAPDRVRAIFREIIIDAYEGPAYSSDEIRRQATLRFKNKWTLECIKTFDERWPE